MTEEKAEKAHPPTHEKEAPSPVPTPPAKKLVVRLLADYWDKDGVRRSASYIDSNGEFRETGALIELPATEARALVKTAAAERGDDF